MIKITLEDSDEEGDFEESRELPSKFEVCGTCLGHGRTANPSIDGNGITSSEWQDDWDPDERQAYLRGDYDITCPECKGLRVVNVVDEEHLSEDDRRFLKRYRQDQEDRARERAADRQTRRMESGGWG